MIYLKCNTPKAKEKYHMVLGFFYNTIIKIVHKLKQLLLLYNTFSGMKLFSSYLIQQCNTLRTYRK